MNLFEQGEKGDMGGEGEQGVRGDPGIKGKEGPPGDPGLTGVRVSDTEINNTEVTQLTHQPKFLIYCACAYRVLKENRANTVKEEKQALRCDTAV